MEALEGVERSGKVAAGEDGVEMIVEDDPGVDFQAAMLPAVEEGLYHYVATRRCGEDGQPFDDGAGDEVRSVGLVNPVAAAHCWSWGNGVAGTSALPNSSSLGTRENTG